MCKRLIRFVLVISACLPGNALAADISRDGGGTDSLWSTAVNWDGDTVPGAGDDAIIEMDPGAIVDDSVTADADNVRIAEAQGSTGRLVMTGGTLTVHQTGGRDPGLWISNRGTGYFDMSGGTITAEHVYLPRNAPGQSYMTMTDGNITTGQSFTLGLHNGEYGWDPVYSELSRGMQVFEVMNYTLPAGANTLEIAKREDGVFLDAILIANDVE